VGQRPGWNAWKAQAKLTTLSVPLVAVSCSRDDRRVPCRWCGSPRPGTVRRQCSYRLTPGRRSMGLIAYGSSTTLARVDLLTALT
jgi:hypothetical protein